MFKGELTSDAVRWLDADGDVFAAVSSSFWRLFSILRDSSGTPAGEFSIYCSWVVVLATGTYLYCVQLVSPPPQLSHSTASDQLFKHSDTEPSWRWKQEIRATSAYLRVSYFFQEAMFVCLLHNVHNVYIISEIIVCWWPQWLGARWSQLSASYWSGYPGSAAPPWAAWRAGPLGPQGGCRAELLPLQFQLSREPQKFTQLITGTHQQRFYWDLVLSRMTWSASRPREPPRENVWGQWSTSCHHDTVVGFISQFVGGLFLTFFVVPLSVEMSREVTDWPDFLYSH